jgi:hypothetical protein
VCLTLFLLAFAEFGGPVLRFLACLPLLLHVKSEGLNVINTVWNVCGLFFEVARILLIRLIKYVGIMRL